MPEKLKGDPLVSRDNVCYAEKKGKTILVQFYGPTGAIQNFEELLVELFWSLQVYRKKNMNDYSRLKQRRHSVPGWKKVVT